MPIAEITISVTDRRRIHELLLNEPARKLPALALLKRKLELAHVVEPEQMPDDIVTLNSQVRVLEASTDSEYGFTLVVPGLTMRPGDVSILAPVGAAAFGLKTGQEIFWYGSSGRRVGVRILDIPYQPEAMGEYHL
ncbi:MAG TPA: GreA/GreB family elongation factor [Noviherbaspirillum sp.]|nr:GreA/GreB family elongation factor [Noviherbaspirillum sp.]